MFVVNPIFFAGFLISGESMKVLDQILLEAQLIAQLIIPASLGLAQSLPLLLFGKVLLGFAAGAQVGFCFFMFYSFTVDYGKVVLPRQLLLPPISATSHHQAFDRLFIARRG